MCGLSLIGLVAFLIFGLTYTVPSDAARNVVCYYSNWPQYRPGMGRYTVKDIDASLCTHIIFAFAKVVGNKLEPYENNDMRPNGGMWTALNNLKKTHPHLKTLLAVGGYNHGPQPFTAMSTTQQSRREFIMNSIALMRKYDFDGVDLDWEYPGQIVAADKQNLVHLLKEMRLEFENEARQHNRNRLLITMAVAAGIRNAEKAYDLPTMDRYMDMYNLMAYDLHGSWEDHTGLASTLQSNVDNLSVIAAVNWYLRKGVPLHKINLGLSFYARTWTLKTSGDIRLGAPTTGPGRKGPFTREPGALSHYEVCQLKEKPGWTSTYDATGQTMYGGYGDQFITYENEDAIKVKLDYIQKIGLGGAMVWALDHDDFNGHFCHKGKYPLLSLVYSSMSAAPSLPTGPQPPVVVTQSPVLTNPPVVNTNPPVFITNPPVYVTNPPVVVTNPPVFVTNPPVGVTNPPVFVTNPPIVTNPPVVTNRPRVTPSPKLPECPPDGGRFPYPGSCVRYYVCLRGFRISSSCRDGVFNPNTHRCESRATSTYVCNS